MATAWKFVVTGRGRFPLDMLRYDACYPVDSQAASEMDETFPHGGFKGENREFRVELISRVAAPEDRRWITFGWKVSNVQKMRG